MRKVIIFLCTLTFLLACLRGTRGCECPSTTNSAVEQFNTSDAVFTGRIMSIRRNRVKEGRDYFLDFAIKIRVLEPLKGPRGNIKLLTIFTTGAGGGSCGYLFTKNERYLIYASKGERGKLFTSTCTRTTLLAEASKDYQEIKEEIKTKRQNHTTITPTATPQRPTREPLKLPLVSPRVVVSKGARRLELYSDGRVVRAYRIGLGKNPTGDKERAGDYRTPEGDFYVCVKNAASKFYLSLGLSYPNREDAERGLRGGLITSKERDRIVQAIEKGLRPPWDTALGGEIFIHGGGSASDWTWGCVALDDADVKELFDAVPLKTPVRITP